MADEVALLLYVRVVRVYAREAKEHERALALKKRPRLRHRER